MEKSRDRRREWEEAEGAMVAFTRRACEYLSMNMSAFGTFESPK